MNNLLFATILTVLGTVCAAMGQIALKLASARMSISVKGTIRNMPFLIGLFLYGMSMILCIVAYKYGNLTTLAPMGALNYVWAIFLSKRILGEKMNVWKWAGILLIIVGVVIVVG